MNQDTLLEIKNIYISVELDGHSLPIVEDVSLSLKAGEILALVGESGCGKSVTAQSVMQLLPKPLKIESGEIKMNSHKQGKIIDITKMDPRGAEIRKIRGNEIAMIFQEPMSSFSPLHTIGNQLMEVIRIHRKASKPEAKAIAVEMLDKVGIPGAARVVDQYPHELSGGMRQRAMIAKALSCNPTLLIADEPTTALDVTIQAQVLTLMHGLQSEFGMAIIFITHDLGVVAQVADRVAIMYLGNIIEQGTVREILKNPKHPYTVNLIEAVPRLGRLEGRKKLIPIQGSVPSLYDRPVGCPFVTRCTRVINNHCEEAMPKLISISPDHQVACFLYEPTKGETS
ncbi:MAG: ABC transporter ATP-binding protein [Deltaproteobacteria bacterium]|nr:ABC transporter ATP-binding protein [Deltaproteobacteria bacterium]